MLFFQVFGVCEPYAIHKIEPFHVIAERNWLSFKVSPIRFVNLSDKQMRRLRIGCNVERELEENSCHFAPLQQKPQPTTVCTYS